jgi:hypothetical protein
MWVYVGLMNKGLTPEVQQIQGQYKKHLEKAKRKTLSAKGTDSFIRDRNIV